MSVLISQSSSISVTCTSQFVSGINDYLEKRFFTLCHMLPTALLTLAERLGGDGAGEERAERKGDGA